MSTPTVNDITLSRTREIGDTIKDLEIGQRIRITNNRRDHYVIGTVTEKRDQVDGEYYEAIIEDPDGTRYEIHTNWRDIEADADDQKTPYTGLIEEPFNDTAPAVTDIEVLS